MPNTLRTANCLPGVHGGTWSADSSRKSQPRRRLKPGDQHSRVKEDGSGLQARGEVIGCLKHAVKYIFTASLGQDDRAVASELALWKQVARNGVLNLSTPPVATRTPVIGWNCGNLGGYLEHFCPSFGQYEPLQNQQLHAGEKHQKSEDLFTGDQPRGSIEWRELQSI